MRYVPADDDHVEYYEVADGDLRLRIANEHGDITAWIRRVDGSIGNSYGGPVYDPPEFMNICERPDPLIPPDADWCPHMFDMTAAEQAVAGALARRVGWLP